MLEGYTVSRGDWVSSKKENSLQITKTSSESGSFHIMSCKGMEESSEEAVPSPYSSLTLFPSSLLLTIVRNRILSEENLFFLP